MYMHQKNSIPKPVGNPVCVQGLHYYEDMELEVNPDLIMTSLKLVYIMTTNQ